MKLAFLISAHTDPYHLVRLISSLPDDSDFFIHIDLKSDESQFKELLEGDNRVHFLQHRVNVMWGSINEVEYQMELIRAAINNSYEYTKLITISGLDYPVWSKGQITSFFDANVEQDYLVGNDISSQNNENKLYREYRFFSARPWKYGSLKSKFRVALRKISYLLGKHKPTVFSAEGKQYRLYKGSAWWAISPKIAKLVLDVWDNNREFKDYFKTSFGPAETFIQTVVFNSPEKNSCIEQLGPWQTLESTAPLTYFYYYPVIKIFTEEDFDTIISSGKMFCRKTISGKSDKLIELLEQAKKYN